MNLREIRLRSWRAYSDARFHFPEPQGDRNIILIGAQNGGGKTSLFEAIVLGLFGRQGLSLLPPPKTAEAPTAGVDTPLFGRGQQNYDKLLEGIINRKDFKTGKTSCAVEMTFSQGAHEKFRLQRTWHFRSGAGTHKKDDEDLRLFKGSANIPLVPPALVENKDAWLAEQIGSHLLPSYLAKFFLFDAEQVRMYAERGMEDQVQRGIKGLLGLPVLESLESSLKRYADKRRSDIGGSDGLEQAKEKVERLDIQLDEVRARIEAVDEALPSLNAQRQELTERVSEGSRNQAELQETATNAQRYRNEADKALTQLNELLGGDLALALCGEALRASTTDRLRLETRLADWEASRAQVDDSLDEFVQEFRIRLGTVVPPIPDGSQEPLTVLARNVWADLRSPPPKEIDIDRIHGALGAEDRGRALDRLEGVRAGPARQATALVVQAVTARDEAERMDRKQRDLESQGSATPADVERLKAISQEIGGLETQKRKDEALQRTLEADLDQARATLRRMSERETRGRIPRKQAEVASKFAEVAREVLNQALPTQVGSVAEAMTEAYRRMARKTGLVDRIEITPSGHVQLLNSVGEDVREQRLSAGEEQIFTQALIWSIAKVSRRTFPFVVDTPLGRLDTEHVAAVLRDFTARDGQVLLLSTDREVVGSAFDAISDRILETYIIMSEVVGGASSSTVRRGWFDDAGIRVQ